MVPVGGCRLLIAMIARGRAKTGRYDLRSDFENADVDILRLVFEYASYPVFLGVSAPLPHRLKRCRIAHQESSVSSLP